MLPACFDAVSPTLDLQIAWMTVAALVGVVTVACLVALDERRLHSPRGRVTTLTEGCAAARQAA